MSHTTHHHPGTALAARGRYHPVGTAQLVASTPAAAAATAALRHFVSPGHRRGDFAEMHRLSAFVAGTAISGDGAPGSPARRSAPVGTDHTGHHGD